ncbi:unnamed protein product [Rotaria sp. Silwood2]|nr:unnamed protein product [Rotaria sp. Silwood2]CAF4285690.1 unnamed protein product [Rotaria sp. Silwood2]
MVCGLLGIMCAGGAYCPLSPTDPPMYVRTLIDEIQGRCVLVHENTRERFSRREIEESIDALTDLSILPIGCSLSEYQCLLVDESNDERVILPLDTTGIGQIYLAGAGLCQCYYNNPELTSRTRIIINNEEFFKTGDLARYNAKGELVHAGRIDFQIRIDNQRIEPAEVEKTIIACCPNEIFGCLVTKLSQDEDLLVAYVIGDKSQLDTELIRNYCKDHLRKHMVPSHFIVLDKFPLNASGKANRKQLSLPSLSSNVLMQFVKADELLSSVVSMSNVCQPDITISQGNLSNA